jgi:hypothetical protein
MWTELYEPTQSGWYVVKIEGKRTVMNWNSINKFWVDFAGKTYKFNEIDKWLDDSVTKD